MLLCSWTVNKGGQQCLKCSRPDFSSFIQSKPTAVRRGPLTAENRRRREWEMMVLKNESLNGVFQKLNEGVLKIAAAGVKSYTAEMKGLSSTIGNEREREKSLVVTKTSVPIGTFPPFLVLTTTQNLWISSTLTFGDDGHRDIHIWDTDSNQNLSGALILSTLSKTKRMLPLITLTIINVQISVICIWTLWTWIFLPRKSSFSNFIMGLLLGHFGTNRA